MADPISELVLGWRVYGNGDPAYWLGRDPKPGGQSKDDLEVVRADTMATHTAIVAQSGSGKSAFLGRLIEEITTKTAARCIVFDPNADFSRIHEVQPEKIWQEAQYNPVTRSGRLPHEASREDFLKDWSPVRKRVITNRFDTPPVGANSSYDPIQLWWPDLPIESLSEDLNPFQRSAMYHCHRYVDAIATIADVTKKVGDFSGILALAEKVLRQGSGPPEQPRSDWIKRVIETEFSPMRIHPEKISTDDIPDDGTLTPEDRADLQKSREKAARSELNIAVDRAVSCSLYIPKDMVQSYFALANEYYSNRILSSRKPSVTTASRIDVIDLSSIADRGTRFLTIESTLERTWRRVRSAWGDALRQEESADTRVPTFIILDEAHNIIPAEPQRRQEHLLLDSFRTIAAEGRKYGLFLIIVSQRPDKLDSIILSECENKALMRLDSRSVLDVARKRLGLEGISDRQLDRCLDFGLGRALLIGRWAIYNSHAEGPRAIYCAARRTAEGGRNLRSEYWARVPTLD